MKKKGLIVATIVMVLVLAVSLTTATYAWFSATASATVESITLQAAAADGLLIGAKSLTTGETDTYTDYNYGNVVWQDGKWSGDSYVGTTLAFKKPGATAQDEPVAMSIGTSKAVSQASVAITNAGQNSDVNISAGSWFAANGTTAAAYDKSTVEAALPQTHYVDLDLGVVASSSDKVKQAYMTILVRPDTPAIKMAAAIHFYIEVQKVSDGTGEQEGQRVAGNATAYTDTLANHGLSAYEGKVQTTNFSTAVTKGTYVNATGTTIDTKHATAAGDWYFVVPLYNSSTAMSAYTDLIRIKLMMWIEGTDDACVIANAGTGGTVYTYFDYTDKYDEQGAVVFSNTTGSSYPGTVTIHA